MGNDFHYEIASFQLKAITEGNDAWRKHKAQLSCFQLSFFCKGIQEDCWEL